MRLAILGLRPQTDSERTSSACGGCAFFVARTTDCTKPNRTLAHAECTAPSREVYTLTVMDERRSGALDSVEVLCSES